MALFKETRRIARAKFTSWRPGLFQTLKIYRALLYNPLTALKWKHSKVIFIAEGGGKTRSIAIGDILSQSALEPIHDYLFSCLRTLGNKTDGTFDQQKAARRVQEWTKNNEVLFCYDLKSCTDRFPVAFQEVVLRPLLGDKIASL